MDMWLSYLLIAVGVLALLLLAAIAPNRKRNTTPFSRTLFAHRGLHSGDAAVPENSLAAFQAAARAGYGVELDVQFTADRQIVVFHDNDLMRMCGINTRVDKLTYAELSQLHLLDSEECIPLLSDVLKTLGDTTLLCEFKAMRSYTDTSLCEAALPLLDEYKGAVCVESFNPFMMRWFRKNAPHYVRGILSKQFKKGEVPFPLSVPLSSLWANFLCRPDFIAYQHTDRAQPFFRFCKLFHPMTIGWTVHSIEEASAANAHFDALIFEGFLPDRSR